jgi:hypothetical protein
MIQFANLVVNALRHSGSTEVRGEGFVVYRGARPGREA